MSNCAKFTTTLQLHSTCMYWREEKTHLLRENIKSRWGSIVNSFLSVSSTMACQLSVILLFVSAVLHSSKFNYVSCIFSVQVCPRDLFPFLQTMLCPHRSVLCPIEFNFLQVWAQVGTTKTTGPKHGLNWGIPYVRESVSLQLTFRIQLRQTRKSEAALWTSKGMTQRPQEHGKTTVTHSSSRWTQIPTRVLWRLVTLKFLS